MPVWGYFAFCDSEMWLLKPDLLESSMMESMHLLDKTWLPLSRAQALHVSYRQPGVQNVPMPDRMLRLLQPSEKCVPIPDKLISRTPDPRTACCIDFKSHQ